MPANYPIVLENAEEVDAFLNGLKKERSIELSHRKKCYLNLISHFKTLNNFVDCTACKNIFTANIIKQLILMETKTDLDAAHKLIMSLSIDDLALWFDEIQKQSKAKRFQVDLGMKEIIVSCALASTFNIGLCMFLMPQLDNFWLKIMLPCVVQITAGYTMLEVQNWLKTSMNQKVSKSLVEVESFFKHNPDAIHERVNRNLLPGLCD